MSAENAVAITDNNKAEEHCNDLLTRKLRYKETENQIKRRNSFNVIFGISQRFTWKFTKESIREKNHMNVNFVTRVLRVLVIWLDTEDFGNDTIFVFCIHWIKVARMFKIDTKPSFVKWWKSANSVSVNDKVCRAKTKITIWENLILSKQFELWLTAEGGVNSFCHPCHSPS